MRRPCERDYPAHRLGDEVALIVELGEGDRDEIINRWPTEERLLPAIREAVCDRQPELASALCSRQEHDLR